MAGLRGVFGAHTAAHDVSLHPSKASRIHAKDSHQDLSAFAPVRKKRKVGTKRNVEAYHKQHGGVWRSTVLKEFTRGEGLPAEVLQPSSLSSLAEDQEKGRDVASGSTCSTAELLRRLPNKQTERGITPHGSFSPFLGGEHVDLEKAKAELGIRAMTSTGKSKAAATEKAASLLLAAYASSSSEDDHLEGEESSSEGIGGSDGTDANDASSRASFEANDAGGGSGS